MICLETSFHCYTEYAQTTNLKEIWDGPISFSAPLGFSYGLSCRRPRDQRNEDSSNENEVRRVTAASEFFFLLYVREHRTRLSPRLDVLS